MHVRAVLELLQEKITPFLEMVHKKRLHAVVRVVGGILHRGRLVPAQIGRGMIAEAKPKARIKSVDRLLGNWQLHSELQYFFAAIVNIILRRVNKPVIHVDWSKLGHGLVALVAAVSVSGRSVIICSMVCHESQEANAKMHKRFLLRLREILPSSCTPILATDAGFKNDWFRQVRKLGWDFVGRLTSNVMVRSLAAPDDAADWKSVGGLYPAATSEPKELGNHLVAKTNPLEGRLVLFRGTRRNRKGTRKPNRKGVHPGSRAYKGCQQRAHDPWLLVTSLDDAAASNVIGIYKTRMQIEESFRDMKSHRFGWALEDVHFTADDAVQRMQTLLTLAALGMLALMLLGAAAESKGLHKLYQANTEGKRRVLSLFYLGKELIADSHPPPLSRTALQQAFRLLIALIRENTGAQHHVD